MRYPLLDVFFSIMWFFLWVLWILLVVRILFDIFASEDLGGWGKAGWAVLVILLPFLGVFCYLIARGRKMRAWQRAAEARDQEFRSYAQDAAHSGNGSADELGKLADLRERGAITEEEYQQGKAKVLT
jgi:hypothetical protein